MPPVATFYPVNVLYVNLGTLYHQDRVLVVEYFSQIVLCAVAWPVDVQGARRGSVSIHLHYAKVV